MTVACLRCGFPNDEKAMHCRACSAPLQDNSSDATIKPRLRQIIAETRARTRARQRRGVSVDPNRVDVVPRLPSGVAASDTALKTALEKGRQARLQGLREELRKGRPEFAPPDRQSPPMENPSIPPIAEATLAPSPAEKASHPPPKETDQIAEEFLNQAVESPTNITAQKSVEVESRSIEKHESTSAVRPDPIAAPHAPERPPAPKQTETTEHVAMSSEPPPEVIDAKSDEQPHMSSDGEPSPEALHLEQPHMVRDDISASPEHRSKLEADHPATTIESAPIPSQALPEESVDHREPVLKPALSAAAKATLYRLRETAKRLQSLAKTGQTIEIENACKLYGKQRLISTSVDSLPVVTFTILWLSTKLSVGERPPEEIIASWLLGESGGTPWGLLLIGVFWLVWCWVGIIAWGVTPGMKAAKLSWKTQTRWKRFARPPLFLISLIPLGLGGTYALLDKNSRGISDILLRLNWYRNE